MVKAKQKQRKMSADLLIANSQRQTNMEGGGGKQIKKIWTISRFVRVILAQGPC